MRILVSALAVLIAACSPNAQAPYQNDAALPIATPPISRCMNLGSALEAMYEGEWGYTVRRADLERLKQVGFDTVRLPVRWSAHAQTEPPYAIDPDLLARVDEIVGWAEAIGLNIIVNVHHYDALNDDPDTQEPRLEALWDQLATHFSQSSATLIFETINEPHTEMSTARTDALNARLLARIRTDNPDRWVILGTAFWGNLSALEESQPAYDPRVMLTYHEYSPFAFTHQGASWTDQTITGIGWGTRRDVDEMLAELDKARAVQDRTRLPVFIGEFGVYEGVPAAHRARWTKALRTGIEDRGMSWCYWDYAGSLKAYDTETEAWIPEIRAALLH